MNFITDWGLLFGIIILNAFFVSAEYALITVRASKLQQAKHKRSAQTALNLIQEPTRLVSAVQVGVTMTSLAIGWLGEPIVAEYVHPITTFLQVPGGWVSPISFVIAFMTITYLHVVLGEIVPKSIALQKTERVALFVAVPINLFIQALRPIVWILHESSRLVLKLLRLHAPSGLEQVHSEEELKLLVEQSSKGGVLQPSEQEMLYKVFEFADKQAVEVMVPRPDVLVLDITSPLPELIAEVKKSSYSRFPVHAGDPDDILGILHLRDLFEAESGSDDFKIEDLVRKVPIVPENKSLASLLAEFRKTEIHLALVIDEYGTLMGIVTLEDLLEEIVGEINDEHDDVEVTFHKLGENHFRVEGALAITQLATIIERQLPADEHAHTAAGFIFTRLGRQGLTGDTILWEDTKWRIVETEGSRIVTVEIWTNVDADDDTATEKQ